MKIHVLQHVEFEGLGSIADWVDQHHAVLNFSYFFDPAFLSDGKLPKLDDFDLLIVLGGPMSVNDQAQYPWLVQEKQFIRQAINAGKAILGICLGAQLIASALGAAVYPNAQKEIGWFEVQTTYPITPVFQFPESIEVFHWHGETFDLPAGAVHLAKSAVCQHQAFQYQQSVIGLQFHLETTLQSAQHIIQHCANELVQHQPYIQSAEQILILTPQKVTAVNGLMQQILDYLVNAIVR